MKANRVKPSTEQQPILPGCDVGAAEFSAMVQVDHRTGKIALKDEERSRDIVDFWLTSGSYRATGAAFRADPRTVASLVRFFADSGKLPSLKEKLAARMETMLVALQASLDDDIALGTMESRDKSILLGIGIDKLAQLRGEAPPVQRVEHDHRHRLDQWRERFAQPSVEVTSTDTLNKSQ